MSLSNSTQIITVAETFQKEFRDVLQTFKLGSPQEVMITPAIVTYPNLQLQNEFLKDHINELQKLVFQYEFTNKKALETLRENIMLRDKAMTSELKVGILTETAEIQTLEIKKRDHTISSLRKDVAEHNRRIEVMSDNFEKNDYPACNICCRNPPVVTICRNHPEGEQIVGCIFCALRKCPMCRSKQIERSFVQVESKKIKKAPRKNEKSEKNDKDGIKLSLIHI